ncbi:LysM peptidoglycan-binding domain-containing protein [Brevibacillus dissolubilis]|uniref:LysM peptidoglycan-binding domain-containing protein n=1 Tax=Brevibacillus dissolubilis TaxID=1844116 RepID=UPI0011168EDB|nr:LysM peptidoglycan-binding domain-containing protein [Brevibacillus dissolubilis]
MAVHQVKPNDTLQSIANQYGVTTESIMAANVICNPNYLPVGQPLVIPEPNPTAPPDSQRVTIKAGGSPYYVVNQGDTLLCLARQFSQSVESLIQTNQISHPNRLTPGMELLVKQEMPDPQELLKRWADVTIDQCDLINMAWNEAIYYRGSFQWEALGEKAVPYLRLLLKHPCDTVRSSAVTSLGRIARGRGVASALQQALLDQDDLVVQKARLALKRYQLVQRWGKRVHITMNPMRLYNNPVPNASSTNIPEGTPIIILRWWISVPNEEEAMGYQFFDYVQILETGETGYLPRAANGPMMYI